MLPNRLSRRAAQQRNYRKDWSDNKRFNQPLKVFVELKYPEIFKEYETLYQRMIAEGTRKRKLTSTQTFQQWKIDNGLNKEPVNTDTEFKNPNLTPTANEPNEVQIVSTELNLFVPQIRLESCSPTSLISEGVDIINTAIQQTGLQEYFKECNE